MRDFLGHAIHDGVMLYTSVSSVKGYANWAKGGCSRRWAYARLLGLKDAEANQNKEAKDKGTALDRELKHYLLTGEKTLSSLALSGLYLVDKPGPDLSVDPPIYTTSYRDQHGHIRMAPPLPDGDERPELPAGWTVQISSLLTAAGVPFVGELDYAHERGSYVDEEGELQQDPPGTVEVLDIKRKTNSIDRHKNSILPLPGDLVRDIQMAGYGEWVGKRLPHKTHVRLSHLVFPEKDGTKTGTPKKITKLHVIDDCHATWAKVESVVAEMKDLVRATPKIKMPEHLALMPQVHAESVEHIARHIPGATTSCDAYGGCFHRAYCSAYRANSLDNIYGKVAEDYAANNTSSWGVPAATHPLQGQNAMGLLSNNPQMMQQPVTQAMAAAPNMQQTLAAEEQQLRQQVAQQQAQMPVQITGQQLSALLQRIAGYGSGVPALGKNLAQFYAQVSGQAVAPGFVYNGIPAPAGARRSIHGVVLEEVAHLIQIEGELAQEAGVPAFGQTPPPPPPPVVQQAPAQMPAQGMSFLPPDAPPSMPQLAMQQPTAYVPPESGPVTHVQTGGVLFEQPRQDVQAPPAAETPAAPRRRGRPKPQDSAPGSAPPQTAAPEASTPPPASQVAPASSSPSPSGLERVYEGRDPGFAAPIVLVNCRTDAFETKSLAGYVDYINKKIAKLYNVRKDGQPGILDVRAAVDGSVLGYGGWKGAVREIVPTDLPPVALYHIDTHRDDLSEAVVDGLRQAGWLIIRGVFG